MIKTVQIAMVRLGIAATTLLPAMALADSAQCTGAKAAGVASCDETSLTTSISNILDTLFYVIGTIAVLVLLIGAIQYITSSGDAKRIKGAKDTITYAVVGLVVAILARAIVGFVIAKVG